MDIHVIQHGEQAGPYPAAQFEELLRTGVLEGDDLYWHEGCEGWLPVSQHPSFLQRLSLVVAPPPPPLPQFTPTRRVGPPSGSTLKICPACGYSVAPSAPMCPHCGKKLKLGCGTMLALGVGAVVVGGVALMVGGMSLLLSNHGEGKHAPPARVESVAPVVPATPLPGAETAFIATVQTYVDRYAAAPNELQKTALRSERRAMLARMFPDRQAANWVGTLKELSTYRDGKASVAIALDGSAITIHTDLGNPFSPGSDTSVENGSALYNLLSRLSVGEKVKFTGSFLPDERDHLKETSFTEAGSMTQPEFVMRFSDVTATLAAMSPGAKPSQKPLVLRPASSPPEPTPLALIAGSPAMETPPVSIPTASPMPSASPSPRSVVANFYSWYIDEVRRGTSPWLSGELFKRPDITHGFAVRLENTKEPEPDEPESGNDSIFSVDGEPGSLEITDAKVNRFDAMVAVRLGSGSTSHLVNVRLVRADEGRPWQIDDVQPVLVSPSAPAQVPNPTPQEDLSRRIQLAENRLNAVYSQLRGRLDGRRKALLKEEEVEWITRKDALPAGTVQRAEIIERRIDELTHWGEPNTSDLKQGFVSAPSTSGPSPPLTTPASDANPWATGSWPLVLYKGNKIPWQLPLPGYWHPMKQPLDASADASWIGPRGMVLTAYSFDDDDPDDFLDALKKVDRITAIKEYRPDHKLTPDRKDDKFYMTEAQPVGGLTLFGVFTAKVFNKGHKFLAISEKIPASGQAYGVEGGPMGTDVGIAVTQMKNLANGGTVDLSQRVTAKNDPVLAALANTAHPPNPVSAVAAAPAILTKAQWKEKMARNFRWYPGTPVMGAAGQFQQVMGKPNRTQTLGDQMYWYYQCSDGTIQLVMNVLNLQVAGFLQADVNDF